MHHLLDSLLRLLFPDRCVGCRALGDLICRRCRAQLVCYPGGIRALPGLEAAGVAYVYQGALRQAIHQLKYRRQTRVAKPLGELLAAITAIHAPSIDAVMAVPLHRQRLAERGFNQAELLAQVTAQHMRRPYAAGLARVRSTGQQARLNAREREENMRGAFVWRGTLPPPARILLIDDVLTTGATISACALALREAGCHEVYGFALARSRPDLT